MSIRPIAASALAATLLRAGGAAWAADPVLDWNGLTFGQNGLRWASPEQAVKLRVGGRVHGDFYLYDDDVTPLEDSNQLRRARLFLSGALLEDFRILFDVTPDLADIVFGRFDKDEWPRKFIAGGQDVVSVAGKTLAGARLRAVCFLPPRGARCRLLLLGHRSFLAG